MFYSFHNKTEKVSDKHKQPDTLLNQLIEIFYLLPQKIPIIYLVLKTRLTRKVKLYLEFNLLPRFGQKEFLFYF